MSKLLPRVLVVDDTAANVDLLDAMLSARGFDVEGVGSGEEALNRLALEPRPDLVLLDIVMPEMDGYEVCRRIRATPATELLPVVMITASSGEEKLKALEAGADDFVMKPFDKAELLARVRSLIRIKQYHDTILQQAAELADWNRQLEGRVEEQVAQLDRMGRLKRFLAPQVAGPHHHFRRRVLPREPSTRDHRRPLRPSWLRSVRRDRRTRGDDERPRRVSRGFGRSRLPV